MGAAAGQHHPAAQLWFLQGCMWHAPVCTNERSVHQAALTRRAVCCALKAACLPLPKQHPSPCTAACWSAGGPGGKLLVLGAADLFEDGWLDKEDNSRLMEWCFKWLRPVRGAMGGSAGRPCWGAVLPSLCCLIQQWASPHSCSSFWFACYAHTSHHPCTDGFCCVPTTFPHS
jgi:hypothetical protein